MITRVDAVQQGISITILQESVVVTELQEGVSVVDLCTSVHGISTDVGLRRKGFT